MTTSQKQPSEPVLRKPLWLKRSLPKGENFSYVRSLISKGNLHTVCQEAKCPNMWECFSNRTATFLIMGSQCTRNCRFCNIDSGKPQTIDPMEPENVASASAAMGLSYVVVTSVTRDDLPDGGASCFAETITAIRRKLPEAHIEVLIPDLQGDPEALGVVLAARPDVLNHNIETVPRLYPQARPQASYKRSLELLRRVSQHRPEIPGKSGLMVGLGETRDEMLRTFADLLENGCRILTIGQYLQPTKLHLPVERYVPPEEFEELKEQALSLGFLQVASGPLIRSSYKARELRDAFDDARGEATEH